MKKCPECESFVGFDDMSELEETFKKLVGNGELSDQTIIEEISKLTFGQVHQWIECFGLDSCYFSNTFDHGYVDEFYFDLRSLVIDSFAEFPEVYEVKIKNGFLRVRFGFRF